MGMQRPLLNSRILRIYTAEKYPIFTDPMGLNKSSVNRKISHCKVDINKQEKSQINHNLNLCIKELVKEEQITFLP